MASVRSMTSNDAQTAGASAWVNDPYMTDTHALWAEIEAASPPLRKKRPESTPRQRQLRNRSLSPERLEGAPRSEKATGERPSPNSSQAGEDAAPKPVVGRPSPYGQASLKEEREKKKEKERAEAATSGEAGEESAAPAEAKPKRKPSPKGGRSKKNSPKGGGGGGGKAKTARARSASPAKRRPGTDRTDATGRLVQPKWNTSLPPRRAPGEVINKYNHLGLMEETAEELHRGPGALEGVQLSAGGGNSTAAGFSSVSGVSTAEAGAASRLSRVTTSPSTRCHPNQERRNELRNADMFTNINYFATSRVPNRVSNTGDAVYGAPDNDRRMKESSWISSQAWFESLRYYPRGQEAVENDDCEATYSGNTHGSKVPAEHLENDVRNRVGIAAADPGWMPSQLPEPWAPELEKRMQSLRVTRK